jgi:hypothetical protein
VDPTLEPQYSFLKNNRTEIGVNWWVRIHSQSVRIRSEQRLISETELELEFFLKKTDPVEFICGTRTKTIPICFSELEPNTGHDLCI